MPHSSQSPAHAFVDRTAVLIGGATGIGFAVAARVVAAGGSVVLGGRTEARLLRAVELLGPAATHAVVDTASDDAVARFFDAIPRVDHVLTTAASYTTGPMAVLDDAEARSPFESKFWGQYRVVKHAIPRLADDASIVLMSGAASVRPPAAAPAYVAANAAIEGLARGLAVELAPVRVTAIAPGTIDGNLWSGRPAEVRAAAFDQFAADAVLARVGSEDEVAHAVVHLFTSTYTTGSTLYVDGGYALR